MLFSLLPPPASVQRKRKKKRQIRLRPGCVCIRLACFFFSFPIAFLLFVCLLFTVGLCCRFLSHPPSFSLVLVCCLWSLPLAILAISEYPPPIPPCFLPHPPAFFPKAGGKRCGRLCCRQSTTCFIGVKIYDYRHFLFLCTDPYWSATQPAKPFCPRCSFLCLCCCTGMILLTMSHRSTTHPRTLVIV